VELDFNTTPAGLSSCWQLPKKGGPTTPPPAICPEQAAAGPLCASNRCRPRPRCTRTSRLNDGPRFELMLPAVACRRSGYRLYRDPPMRSADDGDRDERATFSAVRVKREAPRVSLRRGLASEVFVGAVIRCPEAPPRSRRPTSRANHSLARLGSGFDKKASPPAGRGIPRKGGLAGRRHGWLCRQTAACWCRPLPSRRRIR
jgi:hypothetical protein